MTPKQRRLAAVAIQAKRQQADFDLALTVIGLVAVGFLLVALALL
jgi:hypothetical protein